MLNVQVTDNQDDNQLVNSKRINWLSRIRF